MPTSPLRRCRMPQTPPLMPLRSIHPKLPRSDDSGAPVVTHFALGHMPYSGCVVGDAYFFRSMASFLESLNCLSNQRRIIFYILAIDEIGCIVTESQISSAQVAYGFTAHILLFRFSAPSTRTVIVAFGTLNSNEHFATVVTHL